MSAIYTGSIAARLTTDGLWQYTGTSHDHAVTGWPETDTPPIYTKKQQAGAYDNFVLPANPAARNGDAR